MNPRLVQLVQAISVAALAWFGYQVLHRIHPLLVFAVVFAALCNVVVLWLLRYDRERLATLYAKPYVQQYVKWVCHWAGEQPPLERPAAAHSTEFLLHSDEDFRIAAWRAKQVVFGHDETIDQLLWRIRDALALRRRRRETAGQPPLGSFLLIGSEGIGKRYLARVMAKLLYANGPALAFECDKLDPDSLLGGPGSSGQLVESVRRQPSQLILLEKIDAAPPGLFQKLQPLLTRGSVPDLASGREVSFQNTILIMTMTKAVDRLTSLATRTLTDRAWHDQAVEAICIETHIDLAALHTVGQILLCQQPSDYVMAQVTASLMIKECQAHGLDLRLVDPFVLASEVLRIDASVGFGRLPQDIKKLLSKPILCASRENKKSLSLHVRASGT